MREIVHYYYCSLSIWITYKKEAHLVIANFASCNISSEDKQFWFDLKEKEIEIIFVGKSDDVDKSPVEKPEPVKKSTLPRQFTENITERIIRPANNALAKLYFRCPIHFCVVESAALKQFINIIRPSFRQHMILVNTLSGRYLDEEFSKGRAKFIKYCKR